MTLREIREKKNLTQIEMADFLNVTNVTYCNWENHGMPKHGEAILLRAKKAKARRGKKRFRLAND